MKQTIPANDIGNKAGDAASVVSMLSEQTQIKITELMKGLNQELPGAVWLTPSLALHVTLCEILQAKPYSENKSVLFDREKAAYMQALQKVLADVKPIMVDFNTVEVSPQAIIIRGEDDGQFNKIRTELTKTMPFPKETRLPPDIIHSSIARFIKAVDVDLVRRAVAKHPISFKETITEFRLLNHIWPYLQRYNVVEKYPLVKSPNN